MIVPLGIAFALGVLAVIIVLLVRRQLREKYAVLWLVIGLATLLLAIFPGTPRLAGTDPGGAGRRRTCSSPCRSRCSSA